MTYRLAAIVAATVAVLPACHVLFGHQPGGAPDRADLPARDRTSLDRAGDRNRAELRPPDARLDRLDAGRPGDALAIDQSPVDTLAIDQKPLDGGGTVQGWSKRFGGASSDVGYAIAVDSSGNLYLTGFFEKTVDFGGGPITSLGGKDLFVASYTAEGAHRWSKGFGGSNTTGGLDEEGYDLAVDGAGNLYLTGYVEGPVNLGGANLSGTSRDILIASFTTAGAHRWSKRLGSGAWDIGHSVGADGSGNLVVTGFFAGKVDFGGGLLDGGSNNDVFVASYDASGAHRWSKRIGGGGFDGGYSVAVNAAGVSCVTGEYSGSVNAGGVTLPVGGGADILLACYTSSGAHVFSKGLGGAQQDIGHGVAVDSAGNATLAGRFNGAVNFGGGILSSGGNEIVLASYSATGAHLWSKHFPAYLAAEGGRCLAIDGKANLYLTGRMTATVDFGGGPLSANAGSDVFLASFDSGGVHRWSKHFGVSGTEIGHGVAVDAGGHVFLTGSFNGTVDFGSGALVSAGQDGFVLRFNP